jgi:hypothetical protein
MRLVVKYAKDGLKPPEEKVEDGGTVMNVEQVCHELILKADALVLAVRRKDADRCRVIVCTLWHHGGERALTLIWKTLSTVEQRYVERACVSTN